MNAIPKPRGKPRKYPLYDMGIGDRLFVPDMKVTSITSSVAFVQNKMNWVFTTATVVKRGVTGVEVRRVG